MVSTLLCKPPSIAGLFTTITKGSTQWYFWQFVMHTIGMSVVVFFYLVHNTCVSMVTVFIITGLPYLD